jgi:hypothetical protein
MMGFAESGGFILTTDEGSFEYRAIVDEETIREIAKALQMKNKSDKVPSYVWDQLPAARSIYVYRGRMKPKTP